MTKLTAMRGYSGSGKSTKAREIADGSGAVVVGRDFLRSMMFGTPWTGVAADEDNVTVVESAAVEALLRAGTSVVVDNTNLNPAHLRAWAKLAWKVDCEFEVVDVGEGLSRDELIVHDNVRGLIGGRSVGAHVIDSQMERWPREKWPTVTRRERPVVDPVDRSADLQPAIIVDVDGTLTKGPLKRSPYDYRNVMDDLPNTDVLDLVFNLGVNSDLKMIVMSGRDDTCREQTEAWLEFHGLKPDMVLMRDTKGDVDENGGKLPDFDVKLRLFNENVRGKFDVVGVFDDRLQVIDMWRELGLETFRVGDPRADF